MTAFEPEGFDYDFWKDADTRAGWDDLEPGDTVQVRVEVRDKRETQKGKWLDCAVTVTNQNGDVVATGDALAEMAT